MNTAELLQRALNFDFLTKEEGVFLYHNADTAELAYVANELRKIQVPSGKVTWQIDRNVNTTNVCIANCKFCNFFRRPGHDESYITDIETYKIKIEETSRYYSKSKHKGVLFADMDNGRKCILNQQTDALINQSGIWETYQKLETLAR